MKNFYKKTCLFLFAVLLGSATAFGQTITVSVFAESDLMGTENHGTVTINGGTASVTCSLNEVITLEATPLAPYVFNTWYEGAMTGNVLSTENPAEITITSELMNIAASTGNVLYIVGSFAAPNYEFNVVSVPAGVGTYANVGTYPYGTNVTTEISNYDDVHYDFIGWSLTDSPDDIIQGYSYHYYDVTITDNTTLYAFYQYKPQQVTVTAAPNNSTLGSVTINGEPANVAELTEQTDNTFVAVPAANNVNFCGWYLVNGNQKALVTENTTMNVNLPPFSEPRTYEAAFVGSGQTLSCSVSAINQGGIPAGPAASTYNSQVTIRAQVASGYEFVAWYEDLNGDGVFADDEIVQGAGADYTFNITRNRVFGAKYHHLPMTITITNDATKGTLSTENEFQVEYNAPVTIAISENPGYHFTGWTGIASNDNPLFIEHVTTDYNLTANYVNTYTFNATASDGGSVTVTPQNGTFNEGESVSAQATANDGMEFAYWVVNGTSQSTENPFEVQSINDNYEIVAHFVHKYSLTLAASSPATNATFSITNNATSETVTYDPTQEYFFNEGTELTVTVTNFNSEGWGFLCWKNAGAAGCLDETPELSSTFTISDNTNLEASFYNVAVNRTVTYSVNPVDAGTVTGTYLSFDANNQATVPDNTTTTLTANPAEGYTIDYWMIDNGTGNVRYDEDNPTLTITANTTIAAYFREVGNITVTIRKHPFASVGNVDPCDDVCQMDADRPYTFTATSLMPEDYEFWGWIIDGQLVGRKYDNELTISFSDDAVIDVWFAPMNEEGSLNLLTYNEDSTIVTGIVQAYRNQVTSIVIPDNPNHIVQAIADNAFRGCTSLESIYLQPTITSVGNYAFAECPALTSIDLSSVTTLGTNVFDGCSALREVTLSDQLTALPDEIFQNCSALQSINLPATVTTVGHRAFNGSNLHFVNLPAALATVGNQAFMGNANLRVVTINGGVQSFGEDAFRGCTSISRTSFNGVFAQWFDIDFANAYANPAARSRNLVINNAAISKVVVPEGVTTIKQFAFFNNNLIDTIVLASSVTGIDSNAFYRNTNLKRIIINGNPADITVHEFAFENVNKDNVVVEVPCQYLPMTEWNGFTHIVGIGMPVLSLVQHPGGVVRFSDDDGIPACGSSEYTYHVIAQPSSNNYRFISWSDGIRATSRYITITHDMTLSAIFERKEEVQAISDFTYTFEESDAAMDWFNISNGDNEWTVGNAVSRLGNKSLYVTKDNGATCSYFAANSPYTYTEVKLHNGLYRFNFNYKVGNVSNDNLSVALIPIASDEEEDAYLHLDEVNLDNLPLYIDNLENLYDENSWSDAYRLIDLGNEPENDNQWYRLVFFWNVSSENNDEVADFAAAVDNVSLDWMDVKPSELRALTAALHVAIENEEEDPESGNVVYTWTEDEQHLRWYDPRTGALVREFNVSEEEVKATRDYTDFHYQDELWIHAVPAEGYAFVAWNDGNTDAHRQFDFKTIYGLNPTYTAIFEPIPENLHIYAHVEAGAEDKGTAAIAYMTEVNMHNMIEFVSDTTIEPEATYTFVLNLPQEKYAFMGWANANGDTLSKENPFVLEYGQMSDKLNWERDIHVFALMNELTPCSYEDVDFFYRNMPNGQFNFRGHDLDDVTVSNIEVSARNGQIIVSEAAGIEVSLYDVNGRLLESKVENSQNIYFEVPTSGTYMLKVGDLLTRRVVVVR